MWKLALRVVGASGRRGTLPGLGAQFFLSVAEPNRRLEVVFVDGVFLGAPDKGYLLPKFRVELRVLGGPTLSVYRLLLGVPSRLDRRDTAFDESPDDFRGAFRALLFEHVQHLFM
jgi:hypothetical protein